MKEKIKLLILTFVIGISGGLIGSVIIPEKDKNTDKNENIITANNQTTNSFQTDYTRFTSIKDLPNFTTAAAIGTEAVVNIQTEYYNQYDDPIYRLFFGSPNNGRPLQGSGSGVIISKDGYIVTNNHVVENASNIKVTLNDKSEYNAKIIGSDPSTDLALLKIESENLQPLTFGNSDNLKIGEWVLAIGNPFSLTSTVTAGIVSAKARDISILKERYAIESFIQTDAAVNPGNSGGALININGDLVGINTAIASPTGSYTGYSFAIPANLVKKIVADLIEFGSVQRAYLGVKVADIDEKIEQEFNLKNKEGVLVASVVDEGAADNAGIKKGDVILQIDSLDINTVSELLEQLGQRRPGDKIKLKVRRNKRLKKFDVVLKNNNGGTEKNVTQKVDYFGATFEDLSDIEKSDFGINYGAKVTNVMSGKFLSVGIRSGFVILKINDKKIKNAENVRSILENVHGGVYIEGFYPDTGQKAYYAFGVE